jgi:hypothetical protein
VPETYAKLLHDLQERGHKTLVHAASEDDLSRDVDSSRRTISLSKLRRYPKIEHGWRNRTQLNADYGPIHSENDRCDCELLAALNDSIADFLVTEDNGLHSRARARGLDSRVLYVRQALDLINEFYAEPGPSLRSIDTKFVYQLDPRDKLFESLRQDYGDFDGWLEKCRKDRRRCWVAMDFDSIAGLVIFKEESRFDAPPEVPGSRILKLCTFKIAETHRGGRLGEQMLRQAMCFGYGQNFDSLYLTAFSKQISLIGLLDYYGFDEVGKQGNGELVLAKSWQRARCQVDPTYDGLRRSYPQLPTKTPAAVVIPIRPEFHDRLFPEAANRLPNVTRDLFSDIWAGGNAESSIPSNSIRKAYLANAKLSSLTPGAMTCFYRSQDARNGIRAGITAIGFCEDYSALDRYELAIELIAKRSVYRAEEIATMIQDWGQLKVLQFLFYGYVSEPVSLRELMSLGVLRGAPQSFVRLDEEKSGKLMSRIGSALEFG